jgi:Fur family zinc uptake transcriptional regulator
MLQAATPETLTEMPVVQTRRSRTELEHMVHETIKCANAPIGAYQIANRLTASGNAIVPNQVYRVLKRLLEAGLIRKIHSLSAFMPANSQGDAMICICADCHATKVIPITDIVGRLREVADTHGMKTPEYIVELVGQCVGCSQVRKRQ